METWSDRAPDTAIPTLRLPAERLRPALDAVQEILAAQAVSFDRLQRAVVRYGSLAREQTLPLEEMLTTLNRSIRDTVDLLPDARRAEVLAFVQWWAVHGFHRAD